ncbi:hypothetical protein B0H16DRAFT_1467448 [Mycena metata]|uniref:Uncharacterized protein n=1 Tax=Mycena metata TaxID=1033252 RepID=A0AAD7MVX0_9AGAR|nr:hypothetical protein B0H16DRAFT_1467448 [Mycena metata]
MAPTGLLDNAELAVSCLERLRPSCSRVTQDTARCCLAAIGTLVSNPSPASRSALDAFIPAFMGSSSMLHNTPSPFLGLPASSASLASRSASNALIWAFMGSWRTSFNAPLPSFSFPASSPSSASHSGSHPYLYWIVYGAIRSPLTAFLDGDIGCSGPQLGGVAASRSEQSVEEQKISFDKAVAPHVEALKAQWPENEAGKRIYTDEKGYQWELTPIRLNIWGSHLARGTATLEKAPLSVQFDIKNRIKTQPVAVPAPAGQQGMLAPAPASSTSADKLMELFAMSMMMQQQQMQQMQQPHFHSAQYPAQPAPFVPLAPAPHLAPHDPNPIPSLPSSPAKQNHRDVSLDEFCTYYGIPQHSHGLEKLGYEPGDKGIIKLEREDWNGVAAFGKLTWDKVLTKHHQFLKDAQAGLWM